MNQTNTSSGVRSRTRAGAAVLAALLCAVYFGAVISAARADQGRASGAPAASSSAAAKDGGAAAQAGGALATTAVAEAAADPRAHAKFNCDRGGLVVTLTNAGDAPAVFVVNGTSHTVPPGERKTVFIPVAEGAAYDVTVTSGNRTWHFEGVRDCESGAEPLAAASLVCARGGLVVTMTNTGDAPAEFVITKAGGTPINRTVAPEGRAQVVVPIGDDEETYSVTVTSGGERWRFTGTNTCAEPGVGIPVVSAEYDCEREALVISLSNTGDAEVRFSVEGEIYDVGPGETVEVEVPVAPGDSYDVTVNAGDQSWRFQGVAECGPSSTTTTTTPTTTTTTPSSTTTTSETSTTTSSTTTSSTTTGGVSGTTTTSPGGTTTTSPGGGVGGTTTTAPGGVLGTALAFTGPEGAVQWSAIALGLVGLGLALMAAERRTRGVRRN